MAELTVKCAYCGKRFTAERKTRVYCSERCRTRACRERKSDKKNRAELMKNTRLAARQFVCNDTLVNVLMDARRKYGLTDPRYWQAYKNYLMEYYAGAIPAHFNVNGVPLLDPYFADNVVCAISEDSRIEI